VSGRGALRRALAVVAIAAVPGALAAAQRSAASLLAIPSAQGLPPTIDGDVGVDEWAAGVSIDLPFQWFPDDGAKAAIVTQCRALVADGALFVGCVATDPAPQEIVAPRRDRDGGGADDAIALTIDPFGDGREAFLFRVSASGVLSDAQLGRATGSDFRWDAVWNGAARRRIDGYAVEMEIPFSSIRMPGANQAQSARLQLERGYPRRHAYQTAATPLDRNEQCRICQGLPIALPRVTGGGHGVLLQPTTIGASQRDPSGARSTVEVGGALRWQATPGTRLSATINPDFSQVEADEVQFEIDRRFVLTFDERRPFFLEGREMLESYGNLIYSRRITDPEWGVRALHRGPSRTAALLVTHESIDARILPGPFGSSRVLGRDGATTVLSRWQLLPRTRTTFGATMTVRDAAEARNAVGGLDADVQLGDRHRIRVVGALSASDADSAQGRAVGNAPRGAMAQARYDLSTRNWGAELSVRGVGNGFRADAGNLQRVDVWGPEAQLRRTFWGREGGWYSVATASLDAQYLQTFGGELLDGKLGMVLSWQGPRQSRLGLAGTRRWTTVDTNKYEYTQVELSGGIRPSSRWVTDAIITLGQQPDVTNSRPGHIGAARLSAAVSPHDALNLTGVARYEELRAPDTWVYRAMIGDLRVEFFPRLDTRFRLIAQYSGTSRNPSGGLLDGAPRRDGLTFQGLVSRRVGTRALAFVGFVGAGSTLEGAPRWPAGRSVFAKVAWDIAM
jgi:hypothetical protein